eukprot:gene51506-62990_t
MERSQHSKGREAQARGPRSPARRLLLAAPFLPMASARAEAEDDSLTGITRRGVIRISLSFWTAGFEGPPGEPEPPLRDGFHEGMGRLIAEELGVRAEIGMSERSGEGVRRVAEGEFMILPHEQGRMAWAVKQKNPQMLYDEMANMSDKMRAKGRQQA